MMDFKAVCVSFWSDESTKVVDVIITHDEFEKRWKQVEAEVQQAMKKDFPNETTEQHEKRKEFLYYSCTIAGIAIAEEKLKETGIFIDFGQLPTCTVDQYDPPEEGE